MDISLANIIEFFYFIIIFICIKLSLLPNNNIGRDLNGKEEKEKDNIRGYNEI